VHRKFDFVGGGVNEIAGSDLTGAKMELKRISDAIENGIKNFPILGCDDVLSYLNRMPRSTLTNILIMIKNLGVEKNLKFRQVVLCKRKMHESKESLIVRIVESYTPKDVALPASIQNMKDEIETEKNEKIAEVAEYKIKEDNAQIDRPNISKKRMNEVEDIIDYFSPSAKKRRTITTTPRTRPTDALNIHFSTPEVPY